ncbi:hypothetical protein H920_07198 [Fukomys damarensis]|uniref:Uncharacterized protein n=1 Tax=Fukomys damarensis TaxID=885580 RepID=A0A091DLM0_FUKDA|nr:hypothetical protein H920_07198 [Fukomys damarensis]
MSCPLQNMKDATVCVMGHHPFPGQTFVLVVFGLADFKGDQNLRAGRKKKIRQVFLLKYKPQQQPSYRGLLLHYCCIPNGLFEASERGLQLCSANPWLRGLEHEDFSSN